MKTQPKLKLNTASITLVLLVVLLVAFGIVMVHSASSVSADITYKDEFFFVKKQIIGAVVGLFGLAFFAFFDYHKLGKLSWFLLGGAILLLALVFLPGIGVENYGARRWLNLGITTIQPSEIAKFAFIIFASSQLSKNYNKVKSLSGILPTAIAGAILCLLIILEPNMSITMCVGITTIIMLFVGGIAPKHLLIFGAIVLAMVPVLIVIEPYRLKRLSAFLDPWSSPQGEGFQLVQSLYSLGAGELFGVGMGNSRQKYLFLPFAESDFIFSIIGEELGFVGCLALLSVYAIIIILVIKIAIKAKDRFGCLLATGIAGIIATQVLINIAVVSGSIPPTGLPLPFISAGSTSLVVFMSAVGVVLNISKQSKN
ncbi:MAG: putative lipid II flippase FtsW [Clostridia bacterium]|nr:putative lipid II flippase FtsW [Clostridia bacterium]